MTHTEDARKLLVALTTNQDGTTRDGVLSIPYRTAGRAAFHPRFAPLPANPDVVAAQCLRIAEGGADAYIGVQLLAHIPAKGRGGAGATRGLAAFAADLDVAGPGHADIPNSGLPLPPTADEALRIITPLPRPTFTVWTGGGVHAWWVLLNQEDLPLDEAKQLTRGWGDHLRSLGHEHGYHVDQTGDLARVLRLPGSINHKYPDKPTVRIIDTAPRYCLSELATLIPAPPEPAAPTSVTIRPASGGTNAAEITARWSSETDWSTLLEPAGWTLYRDNGHGERHWTRPGKTTGTSAVSHDDPPVVHIFTSGSPLPDGTHTKLQLYAELAHGGDLRAAWHAIAPPLPTDRTPDPRRLVDFVANGSTDKVTGRLIWAMRQINTLDDQDVVVRDLIRAAVGRGLTLDAAARAAGRVLYASEAHS